MSNILIYIGQKIQRKCHYVGEYVSNISMVFVIVGYWKTSSFLPKILQEKVYGYAKYPIIICQ